MKKRIAALLVLLTAALGFQALAGEQMYTASLLGREFFRITYDDSVWIFDDENYQEESSDMFYWLFDLYNEEYIVICSVEFMPDYEDFSAYLADEEDVLSYAKDVESAFSEYDCVYNEICTYEVANGRKNASLPFLVFTMYDAKDGKSVYMETVTHGYALGFHIYESEVKPEISHDDMQMVLDELVRTISPIE
ncbi:MAG: hypothetical protein IJC48_03585 [Clostridia bacterium]|nr:hypothetical protein [Clostridia bacterium]